MRKNKVPDRCVRVGGVPERRSPFNQAGAVTSSTMVWLLIITLAVYLVYMVAPPYFSYYMLKTEIEEEAQLAHKFSDFALAGNIVNKAAIWDVPILLDDIKISRGYESISITLDYSTRIDLFPGYQKVLTFHIAVTEPIKENSGLLQ